MALGITPVLVAPTGRRGPYDETQADPGTYREVLNRMRQRGLRSVSANVQRNMHEAGVGFRSADGDSDFVVDPVPRILAAPEWAALAAGLVQRTRALECFVADVYGPREIVQAGVIPVRALETATYYEPELCGLELETWIPVAGLDIVRDTQGTFRVLEDNVRTPSGLAYALAVRAALSAQVPVPAGRALRSLDRAPALLAGAIRGAAPAGVAEPRVAVLSDGPANSAYYEHRTLARLLGVPLVRRDELEQRRGRLWIAREGRAEPVDVLYRRSDADRVFDSQRRLTSLGALLLEPWREGRLGLVNAFGTGVADDKLIHAYVEDMIRFYLGAEPLLRSVVTYDLSQPSVLATALTRLDELVIKPRDGHGGDGVVIGSQTSASQLELLRVELRRRPERYVAQDLVTLSRHPTVRDGQLHLRHIDLRPFVLTNGSSVEVIPGGLTRVALDSGSLVVNSSRNGGAKDTWVLV